MTKHASLRRLLKVALDIKSKKKEMLKEEKTNLKFLKETDIRSENK